MNPRRTILVIILPCLVFVAFVVALIWVTAGRVNYDTYVHGTCRDGHAFDITWSQPDHYKPADRLANKACSLHKGVQVFEREYS